MSGWAPENFEKFYLIGCDVYEGVELDFFPLIGYIFK